MGEEVFLVLDFNTVCRFCLRSSGALSDLFLQEEGATTIPAQVHSLMDIQVNPTDGFPSKLCHRCRFKIEICHEFKEMVMRTHRVLTDNTVQEILYSQTSNECDGQSKNVQTPEAQEIQETEDHQKTLSVTDNECAVDNDNIANNTIESESDIDYVSRDDFDVFLIKKSDNQRPDEEQSKNHDTTIKSSKAKIKNKMDEYPSLFTAKRRNQCLLCLEKCGNRDVLKDHIQDHLEGTGLEPYYLYGERDLFCKLCDREFSYRYNFIIHQREHLNLKPFICQYIDCGSAYSSVYRLRNHLLVHADKKFGCSVCKMKFQRKSDLRAHEIIHIDEGHKFQCSICNLVCKNRRTLRTHVRKHYTTPKFKCEMCSKAYIHRSELERHAHIHSAEKRFRCSTCASAYYSRTALVRHEKSHTQNNSSIKKFCPLKVCISRKESIFDTWQGYKDHMENHPITDYPYRCLNCIRGFITRSSLTKHSMSCCQTVVEDVVPNEDIIIQQEDDNFVQLVQLEEDVHEHSNMSDVFDHEDSLLIIKK